MSDDQEIEITPEMIAAGVWELSLFSTSEDPLSEIVVAVFEAMLRVRRPSVNPPPE